MFAARQGFFSQPGGIDRPLWTLVAARTQDSLPTVSTTAVKWGTTSASFNGTNQNLAFTNATLSAQTSVALGGLTPKTSTSAWTFEMWINIPTGGLGAQRGWFDAGPNGIAVGIRSDNRIYAGFSNVTFGVVGVTQLVVNTWYHVCIMTAGGSNYIFINGVRDNFGGSYNYTGTTPWNGYTMPSMGPGPGANLIRGFVQDIRVSNGSIYPTTGFTAPTAPLVNTNQTRLLIPCYNGTIADDNTIV